MGPYIYKATVWWGAEVGRKFDCGIVMAENYVDAMTQIKSYYGDDLLGLEIFEMEEGPLIFNEEIYEKLKSMI